MIHHVILEILIITKQIFAADLTWHSVLFKVIQGFNFDV